jgi:hypothetical protein
MKKQTQMLVDTSLGVLVCVGMFAVGIWRVVRRQPPSAKSAEAERHSDTEPQFRTVSLSSLSLKTPGNAPLDRIARIAAHPARLEHDLPKPPRKSSVEDLLEHQSLESDQLDGWSEPAPDHLPIPTYAPAIMAFGIVLFAMGLATIWYVCVAGSVVFAIAAWRWTGELQGE